MNTVQKTLQLTPTQIEVARRFGLTPTQYAEQLAKFEEDNWPMEEVDKDDDDEFDNPNKQDVMNIPVKTMRDLWLTMFGYRWVSGDEFDEPGMDAWSRMESRLEQYNMIETYDDWYKLKEDL